MGPKGKGKGRGMVVRGRYAHRWMGRPSSLKEVGVLRYGMTSHDMARYGTVMAFCCRRHHGFIFVLLYVCTYMYLSSIHTHTIFGYIYINFYILPRVPSRVNALPRKNKNTQAIELAILHPAVQRFAGGQWPAQHDGETGEVAARERTTLAAVSTNNKQQPGKQQRRRKGV